MRMTKMTISLEVKRSAQYQSVGCSGSVEVELEEGEDRAAAFDKARRWLSDQVAPAADAELDRVLYGDGRAQ
jgi:hypothetical protein